MIVALTIAGSDSGGGAGIQADLKTFHRFGVYGTSAIAAITAQNTLGVSEWVSVPVKLLRAQIEAVASDLAPSAVKTGMLGSAEAVVAVADSIRRFKLPHYVLDPVMVATSGDLLIEDNAVAAIRSELIPLAEVVTPNADEAAVLAGFEVGDLAGMRRAAESILAMGARAVLVKGGHIRGDDDTLVVDLLHDGEITEFRHARIDTTSTHGTGCTLSAAIAALLATGVDLREAVAAATDYVNEAIRTAPGLGSGHGPLNHFAGSEPTKSLTSA
ncbi:MAG: bifunctional hydroxymethylpyrimidine kinase/phosphomethylpyrimidine kinase [Gemmatimonadaceae bacterium]